MPQDLELPPEIAEVFEGLTDEGRRAYVHKLMEALEAAQATNDLRPVRDVIEAYYRTLRVRQHPEYRRAIERAKQPPHGQLTADEAIARITPVTTRK